MSTTQIYDDTNAAFIYQPADAWTAGNWNASSVDQSGTLHVTNNLAANITFTFPVPASGFSYFGIQRSRGGLYGICIDCTPGAPNFISVDAFNASDNGANPPVLLFQRNFSTLGVHQIIIQNMADPRGTPAGNSQITIDRIELIVPGEGGGTTTVTAPSNPTNTGSSPTTSETSATHKSTPIGAIVGGVLGALALVVGAIILFFWLRLRRKRAYDPARQAALSPSVSQFQPDPFFSSNSETMGASPNSAPSPPLTSQSPWGGYGTGLSTGTTVSEKSAAAERNYHQRMMPSVTSVATSVQPPSSASVSGSGSGPPSAVGPSRSSGPRREQDAGPLPAPLDDEEEEEDTLPPEYGQVFARRSTRRSRRTTAPLPDVPPSPPVAEKRPYPHVLSTVNDSEEGS